MINTVKKPIIQMYLQDEDTLSGNIDRDITIEQVLGTIELLLNECDKLGYSKEEVIKYLSK